MVRDARCYGHFSLMCLVKSVLLFLGIILQLVPSHGKENIRSNSISLHGRPIPTGQYLFICPPPSSLLVNWEFWGFRVLNAFAVGNCSFEIQLCDSWCCFVFV